MSMAEDSVSKNSVADKAATQVQPQAFRSKSAQNNTINDSSSTSNSTPKSAKKCKLKQTQVDKKKITNTSVSDLSVECQNLAINSGSADKRDNPGVSKKRNERKKEKRKLLSVKLPKPGQAQSASNDRNIPRQASANDIFRHNISPLYANSSPRYLENLAHHPHYQYMAEMQNANLFQNAHFLPNPHVLQMCTPPTPQNSPLIQSEPTTPRYVHNVMNHPLLNKSFSQESHNNYQSTVNLVQNAISAKLARMQQEAANKTFSPMKNRRKAKKQESSDSMRFEEHLSPAEVEDGLKNGSLFEGVLRINPKQFQHAYVSSTDKNEQDVLIDGIKYRNRSLEGDVVIVQLLSDSEVDENGDENVSDKKQKKGKVVYIKEKVHPRTCIGNLKLMPDKNNQKALFVPRDHRIPRLNIPFTCWPDNFYNDAKDYENTLFSCKIIEWFDTRFAIGKLECNIGQSGDMITETKAILAQTDLDITPYGTEVRHLYPRLDYKISEEEIIIREDCRQLCLFSIDPANCRDIDDAMSCRLLENGNYEIGVHISDVAHFLTEDTLLDTKVSEKATTIYMVERAYHMLPDDLCMLCSLFPGVDKLAFSVFWEITKDAKVLSHRFAKTVIHSCAQLSYEHAQNILEDKTDSAFPHVHNGFTYNDIKGTIKVLGEIAATFRKNRFENGALRIDQPKVSFHLNTSTGLPDNFFIYESKESHQLIEEFMLLANMTVARRIYEDHPDIAFLRCHPEPSGYMLKQLANALKPMGIDLDITSAGDLHKSLLAHVGPENTDRGKAMVLNMLCAKPMTRAKYFCVSGCEDSDFHHYALNVPYYTHFTSPIRRYADIMVHRLLAASIKVRDTPKWDVDRVRLIAAQCNKQKYNAKKAGEMSTELYTLKYIEMHSPVETEAVVVEVREKYIDTIIVAMGLNRRIFFNNDFPGEYNCIKNKAGSKLSKMEITWRSEKNLPEVKQIIEVFSILKVEMFKGDDMVKVETRLVRPK